MEDIAEQPKESGVLEEEIARLREENLALTRQVTEWNERVTQLEETLAGRDEDLAGLRKAAEATEHETAGLVADLKEAIAAYRELILSTSPELPGDMVVGTTIADINAGAERARELVAQVRQELESETARQRVPAGAPPRTAPDVSGFSAREKIRFALSTNTE